MSDHHRPLRTAIDVYPLQGQPTGIGQYVGGLVRGLAKASDDGEYVLCVASWDQRPLPDAVTSPFAVRRWKVPGTLVGNPMILPMLRLGSGGCDVAHITNYRPLPLRSRAVVVTVYDLIFDALPGTFPPAAVRRFRLDLRSCLRGATMIAAISEATKQELIDRYQVLAASIVVIPPAVAEPPSLPAALDPALVDRPYILYLGTIEQRKNLVRLVQAFAGATSQTKDGLQLVLAGRPGYGAQLVWEQITASGLAGRVTLLGYVSEAEKHRLLRDAAAFVYPSLYEGFGMPVLEAMAAGVPVITSNVSALPEAAGDAAIMVDPLRVDELAAALSLVLGDRERRQKMIAAGRRQAARFTPAAMAAAYRELYRSLAG